MSPGKDETRVLCGWIYIYIYIYSSVDIDRETNLSTYTESRHFSKHFPITTKRQ